MKTFKQFQEEVQQIDEALPAIIPAALKLGGMALSAYSGYSALKNLSKGKYKSAAFDALGAIPGGRAFKVAKGLGASKNLARGASALQSTARWNLTGLTPNAYAKGVDKTFDVAAKGVTSAGKKIFGKDKKITPTNKIAVDTNVQPKSQNKGGKKIKPVDATLNLSSKKNLTPKVKYVVGKSDKNPLAKKA